MNKEKIIAVRRDNLDRIVEFKTNDGKIYNLDYMTTEEMKSLLNIWIFRYNI